MNHYQARSQHEGGRTWSGAEKTQARPQKPLPQIRTRYKNVPTATKVEKNGKFMELHERVGWCWKEDTRSKAILSFISSFNKYSEKSFLDSSKFDS